jgi:hypothetical protein
VFTLFLIIAPTAIGQCYKQVKLPCRDAEPMTNGFCRSFRLPRVFAHSAMPRGRAPSADAQPADPWPSARATISRGASGGTCFGPRFVYATASQLPRAGRTRPSAAGASIRRREERGGGHLPSQLKISIRDMERAKIDAAL